MLDSEGKWSTKFCGYSLYTAEGKWRFLPILLAEEYIELMLDIAEGKVSKSLFIQCWR